MKQSKIRHTIFAVISFFAIFLFFHLQKAEIHPWDEGLYAIRALSIVNGGDILDQTSNSLGGLYSSTYPPLTVWMMAIFMKIFGVSELSVRLFSFICSIGCLAFVYLITIRIFNEEKAVFTVILLSVSIAWNVYSRQGMTEIPLIFFSLLCLWSLIKIKESKNRKAWLFSIVFGLSFGLALMTKIIVSFLPFLIAIIFIFYSFNSLRHILFGLFLGLIIAFPWHYYMYLEYGADFLNSFMIPHVYSIVENNVPWLGPVYYLNQIIISNPFTILAFLSIFFIVKDLSARNQSNLENLLKVCVVLWFFLTFLIFSASITKLPHYIIYFLVPAVISSVMIFDYLETKPYKSRVKWFIFTILVISTLWSIGEGLRSDVKLFINELRISLPVLIFIFISLSLTLIGILINKSLFERLKFKYYARTSYVILVVLVFRLVLFSSFSPTEKESGARKTVAFIEHLKQDKFVYLFHFYNTSDTMNPQLEWYFNIENQNKEERAKEVKISLKSDIIDIRSLRKVDNYPNLFVVYYIPQSYELKQIVIEDLLQTRKIIFQTRNYLILGRKKLERPLGKWI